MSRFEKWDKDIQLNYIHLVFIDGGHTVESINKAPEWLLVILKAGKLW